MLFTDLGRVGYTAYRANDLITSCITALVE